MDPITATTVVMVPVLVLVNLLIHRHLARAMPVGRGYEIESKLPFTTLRSRLDPAAPEGLGPKHQLDARTGISPFRTIDRADYVYKHAGASGRRSVSSTSSSHTRIRIATISRTSSSSR